MAGNEDGGAVVGGNASLPIPAGMQIGVGAFSGWAAGYAMRQGGRMLAVLVGGGFMFIQSLSHIGWVEVNWDRVEKDYEHVIDRNHDGQVTAKDFQIILDGAENVMQSGLGQRSGFVGGFALGLSGSLSLSAAATIGYVGITGTTSNEVKQYLSADGLKKLASCGAAVFNGDLPVDLEGFKAAGGRLMDGIAKTGGPAVDPRVAVETILNNRSIDDLRQLEFEVMNDIGAAAQSMGVKEDSLSKTELLDAIESAKCVVKGRRA